MITAKLGRVELAGAKTFILDLYGDSLVSFPISADLAAELIDASGNTVAALVDVSGKIEAGSVKLTACAARGIVDRVINVDGSQRGATRSDAGIELTSDARALQANRGRYGDAIRIDAGANGVRLSGSLEASASLRRSRLDGGR